MAEPEPVVPHLEGKILTDAENGKPHTGAVFGLGFSADGQTLYSACTGDRLVTWDWTNGRPRRVQCFDFRECEGVLLGSSQIVAGISLGRPQLDTRREEGILRNTRFCMSQRWELETGKPLADNVSDDGFLGVTLSSDRKSWQGVSATSHPALVQMMTGFDLQKPRGSVGLLPGGMKCLIRDHMLAECEARRLGGGGESVVERRRELFEICRQRTVSWAVVAPDGRAWARIAEKLRLYEVFSGSLLVELPIAKPTVSRGLPLRDVMAFSANGRWIAYPRPDGKLAVCDATGQELLKLRTDQGAITAVAFTPDGQGVVSGGLNGSIMVWDVSKLRPPRPEISAAELAACWAQLRDENAATARQAMWKLEDVPKQSLPFLRERLLPAKPVPVERLDQLIADLDNQDFECREKAEEELERLGILAEDRLRQELKTNLSLEVRRRIETILRRRQPNGKLSDEDRRALRALAVLEILGNREARKQVVDLAGGDMRVRLTEEANRVLERWYEAGMR